jgi:xylulose-5-phosphate/fructose-6-phosphate phosphoketolase
LPTRRGDAEIQTIQKDVRANGFSKRPKCPMIILRSPKGWTGPQFVDGLPSENSFRSHQVPSAELPSKPEHLKMLEQWMRSYQPEELFDERGSRLPSWLT